MFGAENRETKVIPFLHLIKVSSNFEKGTVDAKAFLLFGCLRVYLRLAFPIYLKTQPVKAENVKQLARVPLCTRQ